MFNNAEARVTLNVPVGIRYFEKSVISSSVYPVEVTTNKNVRSPTFFSNIVINSAKFKIKTHVRVLQLYRNFGYRFVIERPCIIRQGQEIRHKVFAQLGMIQTMFGETVDSSLTYALVLNS